VAGTSGKQGEDFRLVGQHPIEWVQTILELIESPEARQWLIDNGRRRLAADYSREVVCRQVLDTVAALPLPAREGAGVVTKAVVGRG
jgi:glycosyltransferase involved in cell wall biosynthesis